MAERPTDSEMLDWLAENTSRICVTQNEYGATTFAYRIPVPDVEHGLPYRWSEEFTDLRTMIAAAMSASPQPEPDTQ